MSESNQAPEPAVAAAREAVVLLARAQRLTTRFRRLSYVALGGVGLTLAVTVAGDWEAHTGRCVGWAAAGQVWLIGVAWWAFRVYAQAEALEQAAHAAATRAAGETRPMAPM